MTSGHVVVYELATSDTRTLEHEAPCVDDSTSVKVSGSLQNAPNGEELAWGINVGYYANFEMPSYEFLAPVGVHDLVASTMIGLTLGRGIVMRDFAISSATTLDLDFAPSTSFEYVRNDVRVNGLVTDSATTTLYTQSGTQASMGFGQHALTLPAAVGAATDLYGVSYGRCEQFVNPYRCSRTTLVTRAPSSATTFELTLDNNPVPMPELFAEGDGPAVQFHTTWAGAPPATLYELAASQFGKPSWWIVRSQTHLAEGPVELYVPDLSGIPGWEDAWLAASRTNWSVNAVDAPDVMESLRVIKTVEHETTRKGWGGELAPPF
jgi:hypothetical protein